MEREAEIRGRLSVNVQPYTDEAVFATLKDEWNALLSRSNNNMIFSTHEWQSHWWMAYQPGELRVVVVRDENDRLIGIAPWFIDTTNPDERVLRGIGCVDVTDYVDVIIDADCIQPVLDCFAAYLEAHADEYDRVNLCNLPASSSTLEFLPAMLESHGFTATIEQQEVCPIIELPETFDDFLMNNLGKKDRHEMRRKVRRAHGQGKVEWYFVDESHNLDEQLDLFLKLMADSAPYKAEFLQDGANMDFFRRVMPAMFEAGWLKLAFLTINGEAAATYLNLEYSDRVMVYNSGLWQEFSSLSPGIVLIAHLIQDAIERDMAVFDFLRGNEEYKYRIGGVDTPIYMLKAKH